MHAGCEETIGRADGGLHFEGLGRQGLEEDAAAIPVLDPPRGSSFRALDDDLAALCATVPTTLTGAHRVNLALSADPILMPARRSWQAALIAWELMAEAARRASATAGEGRVEVSARVISGLLLIAVRADCRAEDDVFSDAHLLTADALASDLGGRVLRRQTEQDFCAILSMPLASAGPF